MTKVSVMSLSSAETAETEKVWSPKPSCAGACGRETATSVGQARGGSVVRRLEDSTFAAQPDLLSAPFHLNKRDGQARGGSVVGGGRV